MKIIALAVLTVTLAAAWPDHCPLDKAVAAFKNKNLTNPWPYFPNNPYKNETTASLAKINTILADKVRVCALAYEDEDRINFHLKDFSSKEAAEAAGYTVTHQGPCGACSSTQDLAVYLSMNLTQPVRSCGFKGVVSMNWAYECIKDLGFTDECTEIWVYNTANTRSDCFWVCMVSWFENEPFNKPDGSLNDCLQCDEDKSGPVFKYFSGRTRRDSGITSSIYRPPSTIYNMTHCYY